MWKHLYKFYFLYLCDEKQQIKIILSKALKTEDLSLGLCWAHRKTLYEILMINIGVIDGYPTGESEKVTTTVIHLIQEIDKLLRVYSTVQGIYWFKSNDERRLLLRMLLDSDKLFIFPEHWHSALQYMHRQQQARIALKNIQKESASQPWPGR